MCSPEYGFSANDLAPEYSCKTYEINAFFVMKFIISAHASKIINIIRFLAFKLLPITLNHKRGRLREQGLAFEKKHIELQN
jgi:hypothetical protein